jgi:tetratricopeptide (TPR) repeat protein
MERTFDKSLDKKQQLDSGQGTEQSGQLDVSRLLLGGDGSSNTRITQKQLFKDYIHTYGGPDVPPQHVPPQHSEETLSTSFRHDAPGQESSMGVLGHDKALLHQANEDYAQGQYEKAKLSLRRVLDNCVKDPERTNLDQAFLGLAKVYKEQGRYGDAEELYKFLIEYHAKEKEPDVCKIGSAMKGVGDVYEKQGKSKEAQALFNSVLPIYKESFGENDPRTVSVMKKLAKVYETQKQPTKARALLHEYVLPIYKEQFGENDPRTKKVQKKLTYDLPVKPEKGTPEAQRLIAAKLGNIILQFIMSHKRFPDLCNPKLFNDKILHRQLFDRRPIRAQFVDKYRAREYVKDKIGEKYLPELYHVTTDPSNIPFENLPDKFVIKGTLGECSEQVRIVTDKSTMNKSEIIEECNKWLNVDYHKETGAWQLKNVKPRVIIEQYIDDGKGEAPYDYKIFTYNGVPHYIQVEAGRFQDYSSTFHDTEWNRKPVTHGGGKNCSTPIDKPPHLKLMLELAQKLGEGQDFLRIDFYDAPEKPFVGEITGIAGTALTHFDPVSYDREFGAPWEEVYNKSKVPSLPPSQEVFEILRQITFSTHKILEGQRKRQYSQEESLEESPLIKSRKIDQR